MPEVDGQWCFCRLCSPQDGDEELDERERKLLADLQCHGWSVMGITQHGDLPGWAFAVGLWHTFRSPEVAMFGLDVPDTQLWFNDIGDQRCWQPTTARRTAEWRARWLQPRVEAG